jgi:hypothetical protein
MSIFLLVYGYYLYAMATTDTSNINFQLAADFIQYTNRSVFLTGKAGTGKTTFLKYIKENAFKQTAIVAPTGVAAINAGGVTIHSFFQLPFTPFIPESKNFGSNNAAAADKHSLLARIKLTGDRRKILQQLELLIIDEISMVRCDVLDAIDTVLRHFRNRLYEPFGGVQVLLIGDMFQLPPVIKEDEWQILSGYYNSAYFFDSKVMQQQPAAYIELNKIYRQSDERFISILNKVRNNNLDEDAYQQLHQQYNPSFQPGKKSGFITLTTHNNKADAINTNELSNLKGKIFSFKASVVGDFNEKNYPAEERLQLKIGAQVMFIKNDLEKARRYFNGKIGVIEKIEDDKVFVLCNGEIESIEVKQETWRNIRYTINKQSQQVEEDEIGSFTQYPLRLAWAITIHKSQGLTFTKAVIDAGAAFTPGQVYVALSRCTSLEGIVLLSKISASSLKLDNHIVHFTKLKEQAELPHELQEGKHRYQSALLTNLFDLTNISQAFSNVFSVIQEHASSFNEETLPWIQSLQQNLENLNEVGNKFKLQLSQILQQQILPEQNLSVQERIKAASVYFSNGLQKIVQEIAVSPAVTDSRQYAMAFNEEMKEFHSTLSFQLYQIECCKNGFHAEALRQYKSNFVLPPFNVNAYAAHHHKKIDSPHPLLHKHLRDLRDKICEKNNLPLYIVAGTVTLDEMAKYLPQNLKELEQVSGFGKAKIDKYGQQFLDVIIPYCEEKNLHSLIKEKEPKKHKTEKLQAEKKDTKQETFKLFKEGKSIAEIAVARSLSVGTIEGHLSHFLSTGEIKIESVLPKEKIDLIEKALTTVDGFSITPIKQQLGDAASFGEIRMLLASKNFEKQKSLQE